MTTSETVSVNCQQQYPFGLVVKAAGPSPALTDIDTSTLGRWALESKVVVLRGFPLLDKEDLVEYCRPWGEILTWGFGEVLDLVIHEDPKNYLFSRGDVPFHWDGAFAASTPRFFLFQCVRAPSAGSGGETVFCDTTEVIRQASEELRELWGRVEVTYRTDKVEHYGGQVTTPLMSTHPGTGDPILRYAEPLDPGRYLNPLFLTISGIPAQDADVFMTDLHERLHQPDVCYHHEWRDGDIVIVDNNALVHGRNPFRGNSSRHLQRIQII
jgi:alpha-ketoglutarate-dependent taurine dioxygenase